MDERTVVSVVIPTFGRPRLLKRCLEALARQTFEESFEVIVADDGAEGPERLKEIDRAALRPILPTLRFVDVVGAHGPAAARNIGWRQARGDMIAFTDDDCIPAPAWLEGGLKALVSRVVAVVGKTLVPVTAPPRDFERDMSALETAEFITANCFVRKATLARLGGFDARFTMAWREDSDLHFRLLSLGRVVRAREAVVVHPVRAMPWGISLKTQKKAFFNALLYKKHPRLYRERIQKCPPLRYYAAVAMSFVAVAGAARHAPAVAVSAFGVWLALTTAFALRRLKAACRAPLHLLEMFVTSALIPFLAVYWRIRGAIRYRVVFF